MYLFERNNVQIALIANKENILLGVVTDGDIRRSLLKNIAITASVKETMNCAPTTVTGDQPPQEILKKFDIFDIKYIPIVDEKNIIKGLYSKTDLSQKQENHTPVVIMAGGEGVRLRPLTENLPKPLVTINGTPILESLIINLASQNFTNFYLSLNYLGQMIEDYFSDGAKWGVSIKYLREGTKLGTGGALSLLKAKNSPIIVLNGDLVTNVNFKMLLEHHIEHDACITVGVQKILFRVPYGVINCEGSSVTSLEEKPVLRYNTNCGIYAVSPQAIQTVSEGEKMDMTCLINQVLSENKKVTAFPIYEEWHDVATIHDLERIQKRYAF
jgi:dTDP-glucose pyrophosphorylase